MWTRRGFLGRSAAGLIAAAAGARTASGVPGGRLPDGSAARGMVTPEAQKAIDAGLASLARGQSADGSFGTGLLRGNVAITSLSALALMAGGHQPGRGAYGKHVTAALEFVLGQEQGRRGYLVNRTATYAHNGPMYDHGFGTLFLGEVYGMVAAPRLRDELRQTLQRAVDLTVRSQNRKGGWRYTPGTTEADISVTVCQMMALRSARNAGFGVPKSTVDRCVAYVKRCQSRDSGGFRYMDLGADLGFMAAGPSYARTAAGVSALYCAGLYQDPAVERGLEYLMRWLRGGQAPPRLEFHYFYGHYYAAQVMWTAGGSYWSEWYPAVRDELVARSQRFGRNGAWTDGICAHYGTAMACIILQVPNNYLPILQK